MASVQKTATLTLVAAMALLAAPAARAQVDEVQTLNALGDHIQIPGVARAPRGGGRQAVVFDFQVNGFESRNRRLFAVGVLSGGGLSTPQQVALPIGTDANRGRGRGGGDDDFGGFGGVERGSMSPAPRSPATLQTVPFQHAVLHPTSAPLVIPVQAQVCPILNLVIQPIHLDLLGLVVDLQTVDLAITAVADAGNLLGNLLCALLGILD